MVHQYDALGRRVARTGDSTTTVFVQVGHQTIADYPAGATASQSTYHYLYGSYIDEPVMRWETAQSDAVYYHRNQQYSVVAITDDNGAIIERYSYTAYGDPAFFDGSGSVISNSQISNRFTYTGREYDPLIRLYHYRARMYDPQLGRFLGRDPLGYLDGKNLYANLFGLTGIDPSGLKKTTVSTSSELQCPTPCNEMGKCKFEISLTGECAENRENYYLKFEYTRRPTDTGDLTNTYCGPLGCYGGLNRAPGGQMCWFVEDIIGKETKCCVTPENFPGFSPWPIIDLPWPCDKVLSYDYDSGGGSYNFKSSNMYKVTGLKVDFTIQTQCFCGTGLVNTGVDNPDPDRAISVTNGTLHAGFGIKKACTGW